MQSKGSLLRAFRSSSTDISECQQEKVPFVYLNNAVEYKTLLDIQLPSLNK